MNEPNDGMMRSRHRHRLSGRMLMAVAAALVPAFAAACPFCGAVGQSLAQRRDAAAAVAVGEATGAVTADDAGMPTQRFRVDQVLRGAAPVAAPGDAVTARVATPVSGTALLFAADVPATDTAAGAARWSATAADEPLLGHVATAPDVGLPAAERLRWFATRLEHPEPAIAADAFTEFGLAPFAAVRAAADAVDSRGLAAWLADPGIDQRRRGLYGLLVGAVARGTGDPTLRRECLSALERAIAAPADDFRAGFDGLLAGLLVAEGERGIDQLAARGLFGPDARPLDQRHLLAALRFAAESLTDEIPPERIAAATRRLLDRPGVAADAAIDLARLRAWDAVDDVARLWDSLGGDDPLVRRAVAGYLTACPLPAAKRHLDAIATRDGARLRQAVDAAALPAAR